MWKSRKGLPPFSKAPQKHITKRLRKEIVFPKRARFMAKLLSLPLCSQELRLERSENSQNYGNRKLMAFNPVQGSSIYL